MEIQVINIAVMHFPLQKKYEHCLFMFHKTLFFSTIAIEIIFNFIIELFIENKKSYLRATK